MRLLGLLVAVALTGTVATESAPAQTDLIVRFTSAQYLVGDLQKRLARDRGETIERPPSDVITGYLSRPPGDGPFPAIVHLHGCGGLTPHRRIADAQQFASWGYVVLVVDSFTSRGIKDACAAGKIPARQADAIGALIYLSKLSYVDPKRIAVVGYSQGGDAAIEIASARMADLFEMPAALTFKAAVAYYPHCVDATNRLTMPTLVLIGELDDWAPAASCQHLLKRLDHASAPLKVVIYPGAFHSFDSAALGRATVRYYGHRMRYDAEAAAKAAVETKDFLTTYLSR